MARTFLAAAMVWSIGLWWGSGLPVGFAPSLPVVFASVLMWMSSMRRLLWWSAVGVKGCCPVCVGGRPSAAGSGGWAWRTGAAVKRGVGEEPEQPAQDRCDEHEPDERDVR